MTKPLRIYLYEDSQLPDNQQSSSRANILLSASNLNNKRPGAVMELGDSFQLRASGAGQNNEVFVKFPTGSTQYLANLQPGGYDGGGVATELQTRLNQIGAAAGGFTVSYSTTTRKYTIAHATDNFDILWNTGGVVQQRAGDTLGFSTAADDTGAQTYTSDYAVYVKDWQWITWRLAKTVIPTIKAAMFYSSNLTDSSNRIQFAGNATDLGGDPLAWSAGAVYLGATRPPTESEFNDLYVWTPVDDGAPSGVRFWQLGIYRGDEDQATMPALRIGVGGLWDDTWFDGSTFGRNYHTPWTWSLVGGNTASFPADGGGVERGQSRGYVRAVLPFADWDEDTYRELWRFQHQHDRKPILLLADADDLGTTTASRGGGLSNDLAPEKALYCVLDGDWTSQAAGPEDHRTFTVTARGIPMRPKGG